MVAPPGWSTFLNPVTLESAPAMPRFYLHIRDNDRWIEDPEGSDLPNLEAARQEALAGARGILAEKLRAGEVLDGQTIEITDDAGMVQAVVPFRNALRLR